MPVAGGGFDQADNAQAAVDAPTMLVVAAYITQASNDKEQIKPALAVLQAQSEASPALGDVHTLPVQAMAHKLKPKAGRATYALRKQVVEPVLASSNRSWGSGNSHCAACTKSAANGRWCAWRGT